MRKFLVKLGTGLATASLLAGSLATSAFAADVTISGNGNKSHNGVLVYQKCANYVSQSNYTNVTTVANVSANTGENSANSNTTGGDSDGVSLTTGNATAGMMVTVEGGGNSADGAPNCCDCAGGVESVDVSGNGNRSHNHVVVVEKQYNTVKQKNKTNVTTVGKVKSNTGKNKTNKNTTGSGGGAVEVSTGDAEAGLVVEVTQATNTL